MTSFADFYRKIQKDGIRRVVVSVSQEELDRFGKRILEEAKEKTVGNYTAYKHSPHFQGGDYHGHSDLPDGHRLSWTITGKRLHPSKFPADDKIPNDAKVAIAKVLGVPVNLLEAFVAYDEVDGEEVVVLELKGESIAARLLRELGSIK